ncbi:unnamed protein product, partial [Prunus brigantina]
NSPNLVKKKLNKLFTRLRSIAFNGSLKAQESVKLLEEIRLFGIVECTRNLSSTECKKCLHVAVIELIDRGYQMKGGCAIYGSCYIRFELYPFYYSLS